MKQIENSTAHHSHRTNYPIRCIECGKKEVRPVIVSQQIDKNHDGRVYELTIPDLPATQCSACGEIFFTEESDQRINAALRDQLGLLTPEQIRANLASLGLSQKDAAGRLGVAAETVCRWRSGAIIQSRAMDNLLRVFFACPDVREKLSSEPVDRHFGETVSLGETT